ncbi:MAG: GlsB/YeaQ/YmgE family stress response membrane protein [Acidobacteria bacterium]|nr:GlsB/YeaQ/YmgE family stress response membrane protein [Acidobacteriota bacterium]MCG3193753.1 hypothetical protein [Thermoanaerobaculia bacterium]MCK6685572.1 GlsB/YeaQ/YmgE family stress response membrane protein [Thermoanaerobaculia bacterium]
MGCFSIIWSVLTGFFIGLLARALMPGSDKLGFIMTVVLGVVGSLVGGFLGGLISKPKEGAKFHPAGFIMSVIGAMVILLIWKFIR